MPSELRINDLAEALLRHRHQLGLTVRVAAAQAQTSSGTYSRVERASYPDLDTYFKLCRWLRLDPSQFLVHTPTATQVPASLTVSAVVDFLRADPLLPPHLARALVTLVELSYTKARTS